MPAAELKAFDAGAAARCRSGDHQLRLAAPRCRGSRSAPGGWPCWTKRRPSRTPTPNRPAPSRSSRRGAQTGAHRHAGREPAGRSVVDLRLRQSGAAGIAEGVHELRQAPGGPAARFLRSAARTGAAVHSAAPEDRQDRDRGPAGQDRNQSVLPAQPPAGRALRAGGARSWPNSSRMPRAYSARAWCCRS